MNLFAGSSTQSSGSPVIIIPSFDQGLICLAAILHANCALPIASSPPSSSSLPVFRALLLRAMALLETSDRKKIGIGLTCFGVLFTILGVIFFFDKGLLAMGNILFLSGLALTIGLKSTASFFLNRSNYKGSIAFLVGFLLVIVGWAFIGMMIESYGFVVLFSGFVPTALVFLSRVPVIGWFFQQPFFMSFFDRFRQRRVPV